MKSVSETFMNLWPLLSPTGIYLLEDIHRDADLNDPGWQYPFHSMDPSNADLAARNHVQVESLPPPSLVCAQILAAL